MPDVLGDDATEGVVRDFFLMMGVQAVSYLNLTVNFRAIAHEQYAFIAVTDALAVVISVFIIKRVAKSESHWTTAGMVIGGSLAGLLGVWLTRMWG